MWDFGRENSWFFCVNLGILEEKTRDFRLNVGFEKTHDFRVKCGILEEKILVVWLNGGFQRENT